MSSISIDIKAVTKYNVIGYTFISELISEDGNMKRKEDARVSRTRAKLFSSFTELLSEKTFEDITINEICLRADIRRATFYKHFSDKYDFLAGLTRQLRNNFEERFQKEKIFTNRPPTDFYFEYIKALVEYLDRNDAIVNLIFCSNLTSSLVSVVVEENYIKTKERLDEDIKNGLRLIASPDTVAIYLAGGISNAVIKWLREDKKMPRDELVREINALVSSVFVK